jgi:hypothetical protein
VRGGDSGGHRLLKRAVFVLIVLLAAGAIWAGRAAQRDREMVSIELFSYSGSLCDRYRSSTFTVQVDQVEETTDRSLRRRLALVRAGLTQRFVHRPGISPDAKDLLRRLAAALDRASESDDFAEAAHEAGRLDGVLKLACR